MKVIQIEAACAGILTILFSWGGAWAQTSVPAPQNDALGPEFRTACWSGDINKVTSLLAQGAPIEGRDNLGRTPLLLACRGHSDIVKLLLDHGAQIEAASDKGDTPFNHACELGDLASAQLLIAAGANINTVDKFGLTPLMQASQTGHDDIVSLLISKKVDVNFESVNGSALFDAVWKKHPSIAKMLLEAGANPNILIKPGNPQSTRISIIAWAAQYDDQASMDLLLAHGADINIKSENGNTPVMEAMRTGSKQETVEYLLDKGADVNAQNNLGESVLMLGLGYEPMPVWQHMLKNGAKLELKDKEGRTALMLTCHRDYLPGVQFLLDQGADIHATDLMGNTALTYAANHGDTEVEQLLESKGANPAEIHVLVKQKPATPLAPAQSWALAVGAIYAQTNGDNYAVLGYEMSTTVSGLQKRLKEDWEITDKASFLKAIDELMTKGHRTDFQAIGSKLAELSDGDYQKKLTDPASATIPIKAAHDSYLKWKDKSGLAWDLCRCANLINFGYTAHYISADEAWPLLLRNAQMVQSNFTSWKEMSDNYLDGREIWANKRDPKFEAAAQLLVNPNDTASPWNQIPWQTTLTGN